MSRGALNEEILDLSVKFLGREITTEELRLYPYINYVIINNGNLENIRMNNDERLILDKLEEEQHIKQDKLIEQIAIKVTKKFYDFIQQIIWYGYIKNLCGIDEMKQLKNDIIDWVNT